MKNMILLVFLMINGGFEMNENDVILGYTIDNFNSQRERLINYTDQIIERKKEMVSRTPKKLADDILNRKKLYRLFTLSNGVLVSLSVLFLSKIDKGSSYALCIGGPLLVCGGMLIENKINNKSKKMDDEYEIMSSIYAYLDLINFLKGDEVSVLKLKEIRNLCVKDKFIKPLRLLNGLDVFNDEDVIYVEELCVDYDINNTAGQYIKKMVKDK